MKSESKPAVEKDPSELSFEELMGWLDDPATAQKNAEKAEREAPEETERQGYGQFGLAESEYPENLRLSESEREQVNNILRGFRDPTYKSRGNVDLENALRGWGSTLAQKEEQYKKRLAEAEEMIKERKAQGYSYKERHQGETGAQRKKEWWNYFNEHGEAPDGVGESGIQHWQKQRKQAQEALNGLELAKKVAAREEFARKNERYMPWRKNPNSENQNYRPWVKDAEPEVIPAEDVEDGGPGSGNWGHRGRPGLVGGSGKGGGAHYRGGREDIMFVGSRHDWLNGLTGERQRSVTNWIKRTGGGNDLKTAQENIMKGDDLRQRAVLVSYLAEARQWDKYADRYRENLSEEESAYLDKLMKKVEPDSDAISGILYNADLKLTPKEDAAMLDLLAKGMGGVTSGAENIVPKQNTPANQVRNWGTTREDEWARDRTMNAFGRITGDPLFSMDDLEKGFAQLPGKAFLDEDNLQYTRTILDAMFAQGGYKEKLLNNDPDPHAVAMREAFKKYNINPDYSSTYGLAYREDTLKQYASAKDFQEYLSHKYQLMGGEPLQIRAQSLADRKAAAQAIAAKRKAGGYKGDPNTDFAQKMTKHYAKANDMVNNCQNEACVNLWDAFEPGLKVLSNRTAKHQCYVHNEGIKINAKGDMEEHGIYSAGETVFHESGHMIDHLLGKEKGKGFYSGQYKGGLFLARMHDECNRWVDQKKIELMAEFEKRKEPTLENLDYLVKNGFMAPNTAKMLAGAGGIIREIAPNYIDLDKATAMYLTKLGDSPGKKYNAVCDMVQGCTMSRIKPRIGHDSWYYKTSDHREKAGREVFAELFSATFTNPAANEAFKEMFPQTYETFEEMVREAFDE